MNFRQRQDCDTRPVKTVVLCPLNHQRLPTILDNLAWKLQTLLSYISVQCTRYHTLGIVNEIHYMHAMERSHSFMALLVRKLYHCNQIYLVTFMCLTVDTGFIFTKKSNVAKWFFDICNAEIVQCRQNLDVILIIDFF